MTNTDDGPRPERIVTSRLGPLRRVLAGVLLLLGRETTAATEALKVPMTGDRWTLSDGAALVEHKGIPALELKLPLKRSEAVLEGLVFRNGTIEFDIEPTGGLGPALGFRRRDADTYESFYVRPNPKCAQAWDCTQYAPVTRGTLLWDLFPEHQSPAPLRAGEWNHVKLVVSGKRMNAYVNGTPALKVDRLRGDALEGGLVLQGAGFFANLTVTPDAVEGLDPRPSKDPSAADARLVRHWLIGGFSKLPPEKEPGIDDKPAADAWRLLTAETSGLVNVSRQYGTPPDRSVTWLKTTLRSQVRQEKRAAIGWNDEVWVYVNGRLAYADKNLYQPATARKTPDGRCSLQNGSFALPLQAGDNEIVIALANSFFGWGLVLRLDDVTGVTSTGLPASGPRLTYDLVHGESAGSAQFVEMAERQRFQLRLAAEPITTEELDGVRVLCLRSPVKAFTPLERQAIVAFVRKGGSLLLVLDEDRGQDRLKETGVNHLIQPFGMKLTADTEYLHNTGAIAKAGEIHRADLEIPFSGGRAVEGGTPFAFQLDRDGKPAQAFAAWTKVPRGGRVVVMGEAMASLFLGSKQGERLSGVPRDPTKTTYWGKDSGTFMEEVLAWLLKR